jgi:lysozyme
MMKVSDRGVAKIAVWEGIVLGPYRDSVGVWTYGVGHTKAAGGPNPETMPREDTRGWSQDKVDVEVGRALALFDVDLDSYEARVRQATGGMPLPQHVFDALVSWDFNTGGATYRSKAGHPAKLIQQVRAGDFSGDGLFGWVRPKELIPRRHAEQRLMRDGVYGTGEARVAVWDALGDGRLRHRSVLTGDQLVKLMRASPGPHQAAPALDGPWERIIEALVRLFTGGTT